MMNMNDLNSSFCVYAHFKGTSQKEMFYVGKGQRKRAKIKSNRGRHWKNVVAKHGYNILILQDGLTESEAFDLEISFIALYRAMGQPLINKTNGGEGCSGRKVVMTEEWRRKNSESHKGPRPERRGVPLSEHHRKSLSLAHKGKPSPMKGKTFSETARKNMSEAHKKRYANLRSA